MIHIKSIDEFESMRIAGQLLAQLFAAVLVHTVQPGVSTAQVDAAVAAYLAEHGLVSQTKGYCGYRYVSCISLNDEVVHGIPSVRRIIGVSDIVTVDVCAAWRGYCADMARIFVMPQATERARTLVKVAYSALDAGLAYAQPPYCIGDVSAAIQDTAEGAGYSVVRDFAGHGIGKKMHEDPEVLNYGTRGTGPAIRIGMALAVEPMITIGSADVYVGSDGWTVKTVGRGLAAHVEDTVLVTENGPEIITRLNARA